MMVKMMMEMIVIVIKDDDGYDCEIEAISKMIVKDHIVSE